MKNLPKPETNASRKIAAAGDQNCQAAVFAAALLKQAADSHETAQAGVAMPSALRARGEFRQQGSAVSRRKNAQAFRPQARVPGELSCGQAMPVSWKFHRADDEGRIRIFVGPAREPGARFLLLRILRPDQAVDAISIRRMRRNALGAGLGARTLTGNSATSGCVYREKRLTAGRAAA